MADLHLTAETKNKIWQAFHTLSYNDEELKKTAITVPISDPSIFDPTVLIKSKSMLKEPGKPITKEKKEQSRMILESVAQNHAWSDVLPINRAQIIQKFAAKVQSESTLFSKIGKKFQISQKDAKANISLLSDYLYLYSLCHNKLPSTWKPEGLVVAILDEKNSFASLGSILGPALLAGYNIVIWSNSAIYEIATELNLLAKSVNIPLEAITIFSENEISIQDLLSYEKVSLALIFDDLYKDNYTCFNPEINVLHFSSTGIPMLVFESADLDSAAAGVIDACWSYHGLMPWTVRNILVQENVYENFLKKLKKVLMRGVDVSTPPNIKPELYAKKYNEIIEKCKDHGIEVFEPPTTSQIFKPIVLTGGTIFTNNVIENNLFDIPLVTITAFRNIKEGIALANNTRNGLAASIWSENVSLTNEVADALQTANIWVNSHGLFEADVALNPFKGSGNGHIGGIEGLYQFLQKRKVLKLNNIPSNNCNYENMINEAKKAQTNWDKLSRLDRVKKLLAVDPFFANTSEYFSESNGDSFYKKGLYDVLVKRQALGIILIDYKIKAAVDKLIIGALIEGNAVIVINCDNPSYKLFEKVIPKGLLAFVDMNEISSEFLSHSDIRVCFSNNAGPELPLKFLQKIKNFEHYDNIQPLITLSKNIWFNKGQSV